MHREIEYGRDVIVGVIRSNTFGWYVSEKELWILDQVKWSKLFSGSIPPAPSGFVDRFCIGIVNEGNADSFLAAIAHDKISSDELRSLVQGEDTSDTEATLHLMPGLFVDFDRRVLISFYPEPIDFELYAPEGWQASYGKFEDCVPPCDRYWLEGSVVA